MKDALTTNRLTRVMIVDDHPLVRDGLRAQISSQSDLEVCGEAASESEALRLVQELSPDVVVVDISLKSGNGIDLIKRLSARSQPPRLLVSSMHDEDIYAERAVHAGALGYVHKQQASLRLVDGIRRVREGRYYLSESVAERLMSRATRKQTEVISPIERLTDRELEVFELLGRGFSVQEMADQMKISPKTVETYRDRIRRKLDMDNARLLARYAVKWVTEHTAE